MLSLGVHSVTLNVDQYLQLGCRDDDRDKSVAIKQRSE